MNATAVQVIEPGVEPQGRAMERAHAAPATPADLLAMAVSGGADLDKLEKLMALQERWEANEARKAFVVAMAGFKGETLEIVKRKRVEFTTRDGDTTSYNHAELSDITDVVGPALARHQLSYRWDVRQEGGAIIVDCILTHVQGHSERITMSAPPDSSGKKNAIQQVASTTTYLQRYTLLAITGMATKGQDNDGRGAGDPEPSFITEEQAATIRDYLTEYGVDETKFLRWLKVESVGTIPASWYERTVAAIKLKGAAK